MGRRHLLRLGLSSRTRPCGEFIGIEKKWAHQAALHYAEMIGYEQDTIQVMRDGQNKHAALASFDTRREIEKTIHIEPEPASGGRTNPRKPRSGHGDGRRRRLWKTTSLAVGARSC